MDTVTLSDGSKRHTLEGWVGIQPPDASMAKTKWRKTDYKYWEVKSASKSKPGVVYTYTVTKNTLGSMSCSCLGYRYHRSCKHIKGVLDEV